MPHFLDYIKERDSHVVGKDYSPNLFACLIHCRSRDEYVVNSGLKIQIMISALRRKNIRAALGAFNGMYNESKHDLYINLCKLIFDAIYLKEPSLTITSFESLSLSFQERELVEFILSKRYK